MHPACGIVVVYFSLYYNLHCGGDVHVKCQSSFIFMVVQVQNFKKKNRLFDSCQSYSVRTIQSCCWWLQNLKPIGQRLLLLMITKLNTNWSTSVMFSLTENLLPDVSFNKFKCLKKTPDWRKKLLLFLIF